MKILKKKLAFLILSFLSAYKHVENTKQKVNFSYLNNPKSAY